MFGLTLRGVFGTQSWSDNNPFKADGRDILPALRKYRGEVRASELTPWGTIWRSVYAVSVIIIGAAVIWAWMLLA